MHNSTLLDHYLRMRRQNIVLAFRGPFSDKVLDGMVETVRQMLAQKDEDKRTAKKMFSILVELAQNIRLYSAEEGRKGIIVIEEHGRTYLLNAGNLVENVRVPPLREKIRHIGGLDGERLKRLYLKRLRTPPDPEREGGNIGLILVARKSGNPISMRVCPADEERSFVELSVRIDKDKGGAADRLARGVRRILKELEELKNRIWKPR